LFALEDNSRDHEDSIPEEQVTVEVGPKHAGSNVSGPKVLSFEISSDRKCQC
jgi:hypothetical protein